jgi:hypothetical protein
MKNKTEKFFKYGCSESDGDSMGVGEGMLVSKKDDSPEFRFSFWGQGLTPMKLSLWMRLKLCYLALFRGHYFEDEVVLMQGDAYELSEWIRVRMSSARLEKMRQDLDGATRPRTTSKETEYGDQ